MLREHDEVVFDEHEDECDGDHGPRRPLTSSNVPNQQTSGRCNDSFPDSAD